MHLKVLVVVSYVVFLRNSLCSWAGIFGMQFYSSGFYRTVDWFPEMVDDVYNKNMYTISCFYHGDYSFDNWEEEYDSWLYVQAQKNKKGTRLMHFEPGLF